MLMTCIRTDQSTLDASVSHRFEANALIGENITELNNRSPPPPPPPHRKCRAEPSGRGKAASLSINRSLNNMAAPTQTSTSTLNCNPQCVAGRSWQNPGLHATATFFIKIVLFRRVWRRNDRGYDEQRVWLKGQFTPKLKKTHVCTCSAIYGVSRHV